MATLRFYIVKCLIGWSAPALDKSANQNRPNNHAGGGGVEWRRWKQSRGVRSNHVDISLNKVWIRRNVELELRLMGLLKRDGGVADVMTLRWQNVESFG